MKICKINGCNNFVWSGGLCRNHIPKKPLKANPLKREEKKQAADEMREFFMSIWKKRPHYSEISGDKLSSPPSSAYFHHILYKERYKEAMFDEDNIALITIDEHSNIHSSPERYEEINERRKKLLEKYNLNE